MSRNAPRQRQWRLRLKDILGALQRIRRYTAGMDRQTFVDDDLVTDAVIRNLEIVGEAAKHVPDRVARRHPEVPWEDLRIFRNFLVHDYFGVDRDVVWETVTRDLPDLEPRIRRVFQEEQGA